MVLRPSETDRDLARRIYAEFRQKPGSEAIASVTALAYLSAVLRVHSPRTVLECGSGIGTMSYAMLTHQHRPQRAVLIEDNEFCLGELTKNLGSADGRYEIVSTPAGLSRLKLKADLIIGDGGWMSPEEFETVQEGSIVFVEGKRAEFRRRLAEHLSRRDLTVRMHNYCARSTLKVVFTHRFIVPLPRKVMRVCAKKGCWIGRVEARRP